MTLVRFRHRISGSVGIGLMLMAGWLLAPANAEASCGDYVVYHGSPPMPEHQQNQQEYVTEEEQPTEAPIPCPCPNAGCGPIAPDPVTTTAGTSIEIERMSCALGHCSDIGIHHARLVVMTDVLPLSQFYFQIFHPPRSA